MRAAIPSAFCLVSAPLTAAEGVTFSTRESRLLILTTVTKDLASPRPTSSPYLHSFLFSSYRATAGIATRVEKESPTSFPQCAAPSSST